MRTPWILLLGSFLILVASCSRSPRSRDTSGQKGNASHPQVKPVRGLAKTVVTPYLEHPINRGENLVWCATFQMVWDKLKELSAAPMKTSPGGIVVTMLNRETIDADSLPTTGTMTAAGLIGDGIIEDIQRRMRELPGAPTPTILPPKASLPPDAVVIYAYLARSLRFRTEFALLPAQAFSNGNGKVAYFGVEDYSASSEIRRKLGSQIRVLWHRFGRRTTTGVQQEIEQEFALELLTAEREDRLVLARIGPASTLRETVDRVMKHVKRPNSMTEKDFDSGLERVSETLTEQGEVAVRDAMRKLVSSYPRLLADEDVRIPKIKFDLAHRFDALVGQVVVSGNARVNGLPIVEALQRIRFAFDEKGAELESEAVSGFFGDVGLRDFSFTRPFLILLLRAGAERPYFALWVGNSEVLVAAE